MAKKDSLLIIFIKNAVNGKVKTRIAATLGNKKALAIYKSLLHHTLEITQPVAAEKAVWYSNEIIQHDEWSRAGYLQKLQSGNDLGDRMATAFRDAFSAGFKKNVIIGSDCLQLTTALIDEAFSQLDNKEAVIGPATDGGYYLLGMKEMKEELFKNKKWSSSSVLADTLRDLKAKTRSIYLLPELCDVDEEAAIPQELLNQLHAG